MSIGTESDLGPHPTTLIDEALARTTSRSAYSSEEVSDLLLDIQQSLVRWSEESPD